MDPQLGGDVFRNAINCGRTAVSKSVEANVAAVELVERILVHQQ